MARNVHEPPSRHERGRAGHDGDRHERSRPQDITAARRHREQLVRREQALEEMHDARRRDLDDPRRRRHEAEKAERHRRTAARHEGHVRALDEQEAEEHRQLRSLTTRSKGAITAYRVLLPLGLLVALGVGIAGIYGLASPGLIPVGVAVMALTIGVVVNGAILFALLLSITATDRRVQQLARIQAARHAERLRRTGARHEARLADLEDDTGPTQVNMLEMHRVAVRPHRADRPAARETTADTRYRTQ